MGEVAIHYSEKEAGWYTTTSIDRIDFIKLDFEGSELDALLGAQQMLCRFHLTIVAETKGGWNHDEIHQLLSATGYESRSFHGDSIGGVPSF